MRDAGDESAERRALVPWSRDDLDADRLTSLLTASSSTTLSNSVSCQARSFTNVCTNRGKRGRTPAPSLYSGSISRIHHPCIARRPRVRAVTSAVTITTMGSRVPLARIDAPSAYVTLTGPDGEPLGTYLLSLLLRGPQEVRVGEAVWDIQLRFRRYYKPYSLHLYEFSHDRYTGTNVPMNFSSRVRLVDPSQNEDREVLIKMNEPLRYGGLTFFQFQMSTNTVGPLSSTLQVVRNPSWLTPYVSCVLVTLGRMIQFMSHLIGFVTTRK